MTGPTTPPPDTAQMAGQSLPEAAFPGGLLEGYRVYFSPAAHEGVWKHAAESPGVEICGVLVGDYARDSRGSYARVDHFIVGEGATNKFTEVTFTHETWNRINQTMDKDHPSLRIVGWYHSHPDFGIFLSDRDRFIHENFFSGPGQIAHVIDPVRKTEGAFVWKAGKPHLATAFWVGTEVRYSTAAGQESGGTLAPLQISNVGEPASLNPRTEAGARAWMLGLTQLVTLVLAVLCGYLLGQYLSVRVGAEERNRAVNDGIAQAFFSYRIKPGMRQRVVELRNALILTARELDALGREAAEKGGEDEFKARYRDKLETLVALAAHLELLGRDYALSQADEEAILKALAPKAPPVVAEEPKKPAEEPKKEAEKPTEPARP